MRDEVQLAKVELTDSAKQAARAGGMLGAAAFAGYMTIILVSLAVAWGLAELVPVGVAFLIVGLIWAAVGAALYATGRQRLQAAELKPEQTIETMQENVQWAKTTDQLKADIEYRRERMSGTVDAIEDRVVPGRIIRRRTDAARDWMGQACDRVMGPPQKVKAQVGALPDQAASGADQFAENVTALPEQISDQTRGVPLVAGGIAFGVGALFALRAARDTTRASLGGDPRAADLHADRCREGIRGRPQRTQSRSRPSSRSTSSRTWRASTPRRRPSRPRVPRSRSPVPHETKRRPDRRRELSC